MTQSHFDHFLMVLFQFGAFSWLTLPRRCDVYWSSGTFPPSTRQGLLYGVQVPVQHDRPLARQSPAPAADTCVHHSARAERYSAWTLRTEVHPSATQPCVHHDQPVTSRRVVVYPGLPLCVALKLCGVSRSLAIDTFGQ